jgi:hypothetical protein
MTDNHPKPAAGWIADQAIEPLPDETEAEKRAKIFQELREDINWIPERETSMIPAPFTFSVSASSTGTLELSPSINMGFGCETGSQFCRCGDASAHVAPGRYCGACGRQRVDGVQVEREQTIAVGRNQFGHFDDLVTGDCFICRATRESQLDNLAEPCADQTSSARLWSSTYRAWLPLWEPFAGWARDEFVWACAMSFVWKSEENPQHRPEIAISVVYKYSDRR